MPRKTAKMSQALMRVAVDVPEDITMGTFFRAMGILKATNPDIQPLGRRAALGELPHRSTGARARDVLLFHAHRVEKFTGAQMTELLVQAGFSKDSAPNIIFEMKKEKVLKRVGYGEYALTAPKLLTHQKGGEK